MWHAGTFCLCQKRTTAEPVPDSADNDSRCCRFVHFDEVRHRLRTRCVMVATIAARCAGGGMLDGI